MTAKHQNISEELKAKWNKLNDYLKKHASLVVAYSGGVDSTFLLKTAHALNPSFVKGLIAKSASLSEREYKQAITVARKHQLPIETIDTTELENSGYIKNDQDRCYYCKSDLFTHLIEYANKNNIQYIADGTNADDIKGHRPGHRAAREKNILSPLLENNLSKEDIRNLSKMLNLETHEKPAMACLASRISTGHTISENNLRMVEKAEEILFQLGFHHFRVRYHENGGLARIELNPDEFEKVFSSETRVKIYNEIKKIGFSYVTLDIIGYTS